MQLTSIIGEITGEMHREAFVGGRFHIVRTSLGMSEAICMEYNTLSWKNGHSVDFSTVSCAFDGFVFVFLKDEGGRGRIQLYMK